MYQLRFVKRKFPVDAFYGRGIFETKLILQQLVQVMGMDANGMPTAGMVWEDVPVVEEET